MNRFRLKFSVVLSLFALLYVIITIIPVFGVAQAANQAPSIGNCYNGFPPSPNDSPTCPAPSATDRPTVDVCLDGQNVVRKIPTDTLGNCTPYTIARAAASTPPANQPPANQPPATPPPGTPTTGGPALLCDPTFSTTKNGLCLPNNPLGNPTGIAGSGSLTELAAKIIDILLYFSGIVAVIFVIYGGYVYMTAGGNEENATKGRRILTDAIIGLVIVILAYVIITSVSNFILNK